MPKTTPSRVMTLDVIGDHLVPRQARIVEIAAVTIEDGVILDQWSCLLDPGRKIGRGLEIMHEIKASDIEARPAFAEVADAIDRALWGCPLVIFSTGLYPIHVLRYDFDRAGRSMPWRPSARIHNLADPTAGGRRVDAELGAVCRRLEVPAPEHNRALARATSIAALWTLRSAAGAGPQGTRSE